MSKRGRKWQNIFRLSIWSLLFLLSGIFSPVRAQSQGVTCNWAGTGRPQSATTCEQYCGQVFNTQNQMICQNCSVAGCTYQFQDQYASCSFRGNRYDDICKNVRADLERKELERKRAEEEQTARERRRQELGEWTCVFRFDQQFSLKEPEKRIDCRDLHSDKDLKPANATEANSMCESQCGPYGLYGSTHPIRCIFIRGLKCDEYMQLLEQREKTDIPFELGNIERDIDALRELTVGKKGVTATGFIGRLIRLLMGGIGMVALIVFLYGGFMWMTARGNAEMAGKSIKTLLWGALGVIVILTSYAIVDFVLEAFR